MNARLPGLATPVWIALGVSVALALFPGGRYPLYPFRLFTTWVHECCHALAAWILGGRVREITLSADTSGLTHFQLPRGRVRQALVASAGYLGSSAAGCALYFAALRAPAYSRDACLALGALMLASAALWVRNRFGFAAVVGIGAALLGVGLRASARHAEWLLLLLAVQTALGALYDVRILFSLGPGARSDARTMQSLLWLPAWVWALGYLAAGACLTLWTVRHA